MTGINAHCIVGNSLTDLVPAVDYNPPYERNVIALSHTYKALSTILPGDRRFLHLELEISDRQQSILADHQVAGTTVFPGAGALEFGRRGINLISKLDPTMSQILWIRPCRKILVNVKLQLGHGEIKFKDSDDVPFCSAGLLCPRKLSGQSGTQKFQKPLKSILGSKVPKTPSQCVASLPFLYGCLDDANQIVRIDASFHLSAIERRVNDSETYLPVCLEYYHAMGNPMSRASHVQCHLSKERAGISQSKGRGICQDEVPICLTGLLEAKMAQLKSSNLRKIKSKEIIYELIEEVAEPSMALPPKWGRSQDSSASGYKLVPYHSSGEFKTFGDVLSVAQITEVAMSRDSRNHVSSIGRGATDMRNAIMMTVTAVHQNENRAMSQALKPKESLPADTNEDIFNLGRAEKCNASQLCFTRIESLSR